jgi:AAA domain
MTKSRLRAIAPQHAEPSKPKVLIFGKSGVGKTWTSLDFPSCYYIDTEGGADLAHYTAKLEAAEGVYLGPDQGSIDFATIIDQVKALATERHPYRTLIIDSITKVFALEIAREAERLGDRDAFGASKKPAVAYMRALVAALMRVDMNVILIAHEIEQWGQNERGERTVVGATFDAWPKLEYELHLALHITKQGNSRYAQVRKSRLTGFPDGSRFPWSYAEFAERYGRDVVERVAKPVEVATAEQIAEAERLLGVVRMPDGWLEKCLSAAGVDTLVELDTDKIEKLINAIKERAKS